MTIRSIALAATAAAALAAVPGIAEASWGHATGTVNMRTCASTSCPVITVIPAGTQVWLNGGVGSWYHVNYAGRDGFVAANYVAGGQFSQPRPGSTVTLSFSNRPAAPTFGFYRTPTWDARYGAWYDGRRWYMNGQWYDQPPGLSFCFSFGGR